MKPKYHDLTTRIADQRKWIEGCEANGVSYADGERGRRIAEADENELRKLISIRELL